MAGTDAAATYLRPLSAPNFRRSETAYSPSPCLYHRPKWLLLDEPFSALDADLRQQMRQLVGELQSELSVPMLIISHDSADTNALADEVLYMENGRLNG